jgi:hypothetical protein
MEHSVQLVFDPLKVLNYLIRGNQLEYSRLKITQEYYGKTVQKRMNKEVEQIYRKPG